MTNTLLKTLAPYLAILFLMLSVFSYVKYIKTDREKLKLEVESKDAELELKENEVVKVGFEEKWEATTVPVTIEESETIITERNDSETNDTIYTIQFIKAMK